MPLTQQVRSGDFPRPAGQNPFRVKGIAYIGGKRFVEKKLPGGLSRLRDEISNAHLRQFFEQPFLAASWYDAYPLLTINAVCASALGKTPEALAHERGVAQAHHDYRGVYRVITRMLSPTLVLTKLPIFGDRYYDFGQVTVARSTGPRSVEFARAGTPADLLPWFVPVTEGYTMTLLALNGVRNPGCTRTPPKFTGVERGARVASVQWNVSWEE